MKRILALSTFILVLAAAGACSPRFAGVAAKTCTTNRECATGSVCNAAGLCVSPSDDPIRLGMSVPLSGTTKELGIEMRNGVQLALAYFNDQVEKGGAGRPLVLDVRDDGYEGPFSQKNTRDLIAVRERQGNRRCQPVTGIATAAELYSATPLDRGPGSVLAMIGNVGTPTMVQSAPIALESGTLLFGAYTGANAILRNGSAGAECSRYVFNVRTSYANEARAALEMFAARGVRYRDHIISFDQNDTFGDAGYSGLIAAYQNLQATLFEASQKGTSPDPGAWLPLPPATPDGEHQPFVRVRYTRNQPDSVAPAADQAIAHLTALLSNNTANHAVAFLMTDTYQPGAAFIQQIRSWQYSAAPEPAGRATRLQLTFSNVSFVGPDALARQLDSDSTAMPVAKHYSDGVFVTQAVPNPSTDLGDTAKLYRQESDKRKTGQSFTAFEGFINGLVLINGIRTIEGAITPESTVDALERMPDINLGLNVGARYSGTSHNYLRGVWITEVKPGARFRDAYVWSERDGAAHTVTIETLP